MIRALILDLNGVLVKGPRLTKRLMADFSVAEDDTLITFKDVMGILRKPNAPEMYSVWEPHLKRWGSLMTTAQWYEYWFSKEQLVQEMIDIARKAKEASVKIIILSNNLRERTKYYDQTFPVLCELADKIYYSWQTGFVKPSRGALELVLKDFPYQPDEFLYFDDGEESVALARELGIRAFLFKSAKEVAEKLE